MLVTSASICFAFSTWLLASFPVFFRVAISVVTSFLSWRRSFSFVRFCRHVLSAVISALSMLRFSGLPLLDRLSLTNSGFSRMSLMSNIFSHGVGSVVVDLLGYLNLLCTVETTLSRKHMKV
jgi:hypothetical protein